MLKFWNRAAGRLKDWEAKLLCDKANEARNLLSR